MKGIAVALMAICALAFAPPAATARTLPMRVAKHRLQPVADAAGQRMQADHWRVFDCGHTSPLRIVCAVKFEDGIDPLFGGRYVSLRTSFAAQLSHRSDHIGVPKFIRWAHVIV